MEMKILTTSKKNGSNSCKYIMLHHTAMGQDSNGYNAARYLSGPITQGGKVSVHYIVGKDGTIWKIGEDTDRLWHAGDGDINPFKGYDGNSNFIGIEIDSNGYDYTKIQFDAVTELVLKLMKEHSISTENIIRHADYSTRKWDVGQNFFKVGGLEDLKAFKNYLLTIKIMNNYKDIFNKEFPQGSSIFKDLDGASKDLTSPEQIAYFMAIGLERIIKLNKDNGK